MASFISTLSLFILVLSQSCFTLPIINQQLLSLTSNNDLTTEQAFNLRLVADDETDVLPNTEKISFNDEHIGFQISTSANGLSEEKTRQEIHTLNEFSTSKSSIYTTEQSSNDKYNNHDYSSFPTIESITQAVELQQQAFINDLETKNDKQEPEIELTTIDMILFPSTSSSVAPKFSKSSSSSVAPQIFTSQSSTSSSKSTEKYPDLLKDDNEHDHDQEQTTKSIKTQKKFEIKAKVQLEEDSKESTVPTAVFDQEALKKIVNIPNDYLILDENNDIVVTGLPSQMFTSTMKTKNEQKSLNQGKESSQSKEKESNH